MLYRCDRSDANSSDGFKLGSKAFWEYEAPTVWSSEEVWRSNFPVYWLNFLKRMTSLVCTATVLASGRAFRTRLIESGPSRRQTVRLNLQLPACWFNRALDSKESQWWWQLLVPGVAVLFANMIMMTPTEGKARWDAVMQLLYDGATSDAAFAMPLLSSLPIRQQHRAAAIRIITNQQKA